MSRLEEINRLHKDLQRKNKILDSMLWVWCSGSCNGGVNRYSDEILTLEDVELVERNTKRLRCWYNNQQLKLMTESEKSEYFRKKAD